MKSYDMITFEQAGQLSINELIDAYNDAVETIWHLQNSLHELMLENEHLWEVYENIADELYG